MAKESLAVIDPTSAEIASLREDWSKAPVDLNDAVSFDDLIAQARVAGLGEEDTIFIASPYTVLNKDKDVLLSRPFYIRWFRFGQDDVTKKYYTVFYAVDRENNMYAVTDGSTGIKQQLVTLYNKRAADKHATPDGNVLVANGLRKSEYIYTDPNTGEQSPAVTYYLA